jgi:hypothetical protein
LTTTTASLELDTGVEVEVEVEVGDDAVENGSEVGGRPERREQPRGRAGFLVVEPKNAWSGTGESNQDAGWSSRSVGKKKS